MKTLICLFITIARSGIEFSCIRVRINFIEHEEEMYTCVDKENKPWKNRELSFCPISINDEAPKKNEREREILAEFGI